MITSIDAGKAFDKIQHPFMTVKVQLFADDRYIENPKYSTRKLLSVNSVKLQDTKLTQRNQLYFYKLTMKDQKEKLRK